MHVIQLMTRLHNGADHSACAPGAEADGGRRRSNEED